MSVYGGAVSNFRKEIHEHCYAFSGAAGIALVYGNDNSNLGELVPALAAGDASIDAGVHDCDSGFLCEDPESHLFLLGTLSGPIR